MTVPGPPPTPEIPWGPILTGIGIAASLTWNFINTLFTRSVKRRDMRVEEFKRLRTRLDTAIDGLRGTVTSLRGLSQSASSKTGFSKSIEALNLELASQTGKVRTVLGDLDSSRYAHGDDWTGVIAPHWDNAAAALNGGYNTTKTLAEQKQSVADSSAHLEAMIKAMNDRIEAEMSRYASEV